MADNFLVRIIKGARQPKPEEEKSPHKDVIVPCGEADDSEPDLDLTGDDDWLHKDD